LLKNKSKNEARAILLTLSRRGVFMRLTNDDIIHELKLRLEKEGSIKKKVQLKQIIEHLKHL
jgi:hypothetical protein